MLKKIAQIYINRELYIALIALCVLFVFGNYFELCLILGNYLLFGIIFISLFEIILLFTGSIVVKRQMANKFSNGSSNLVQLTLKNNFPISLKLIIYEDLPVQFQARNFFKKLKMQARSKQSIQYYLKPVMRGEYYFGHTHIFAKIFIGFLSRKIVSSTPETIAVYPSFSQLKKIQLIAFSNINNMQGNSKNKFLGNNKEFEEIKEYVPGDDYRSINWKATARIDKLMVNKYQQEKSQKIIQVIDMGRTMKMPFDELTLLDYSINSALAISNIIIKKQDKAGIITYSNKIHNELKPANSPIQMKKIMELLYAQQTNFAESSLETVFLNITKGISGRSLIILYTNFESIQGLERQLPLLKKMAQNHLFLLVTFINTEMLALLQNQTNNLENVYVQTIAEKMILQKKLFLKQLSHYGIMHLYIKPKELTVSVLNKYLEIKAKGLI